MSGAKEQSYVSADTRYIQNGNKISFQREELTCYHKGEYGWETYKTINFKTERDAIDMFKQLRCEYSQGKRVGIEITRAELQNQLRKITFGDN